MHLNGCIKCFNLWYSKAFWRFMDKEHKKYCCCLFIAMRKTFSEHKILGVVSLIGIMPF